jgi:hypothetical protein
MLPILRRRVLRVVSFASLTALATIVACDIPSEAPIFQQTWIVPSDSVTVDAAEIAPNGVAVTTGTPPTFVLTTPSVNIATTLAEICEQPACQTAVTVTVPTPAFTSPDDEMAATIAFPAGVTGATVTGGAFHITLTNNLGFDPLRPNGAGSAPYGTLSVTVTSGALTANYVITGSPTVGMPNGATTPLVLQLPTGTYTGSVGLELTLNVPAGNAATINGSNGLEISASLQGLTVTQTTIAVVNDSVKSEATEFDLQDIDFADEVEAGALLLTTANPFTASATLNVVIEAPEQQDGRPPVIITKAITIPAQPTSTATINLSKAEMASLLGKGGVTISVTGAVSGTGPGNTIVITPTSRIVVRTQLQLILNIGA